MARKVNPKTIYISEDLAEDTRRRRKDQLNNLKEAKAQGKIAYRKIPKISPFMYKPLQI